MEQGSIDRPTEDASRDAETWKQFIPFLLCGLCLQSRQGQPIVVQRFIAGKNGETWSQAPVGNAEKDFFGLKGRFLKPRSQAWEKRAS
jgi:hypothetical protein